MTLPPSTLRGSAEQWNAQMMWEHKMAPCEGVSVGRKIRASLGYTASEIKENKEDNDKISIFSWKN